MAKIKAVASGVLNLGGREVDCYVLEDGRRVLSQRGIMAGITGAKGGAKNGNLTQCGSKAEFWRRMRHHYCREPLQLGLGA